MKKCLYCTKEIQDNAIKCKYCKKILNKTSNKELKGIKGGLLIFIIFFRISWGLKSIKIFSGYNFEKSMLDMATEKDKLNGIYSYLSYLDSLHILLFIVLSITLFSLLKHRKKIFPKVIIFYELLLIFTSYFQYYNSQIYDSLYLNFYSVLGASILSILTIGYFINSKRVKNTFTEPIKFKLK